MTSRNDAKHRNRYGSSIFPHGPPLIGDLLDDSPSLSGVQVEVPGLIEASEDSPGQVPDVIRKGR
jgi:hypothetical protein